MISRRLDPWAESVINEIGKGRRDDDGRENANAPGSLRTSPSV